MVHFGTTENPSIGLVEKSHQAAGNVVHTADDVDRVIGFQFCANHAARRDAGAAVFEKNSAV